MIRESVFKRYCLPGFVFQSVVIAGGYGTGRELVEFFLTRGPLGGLLSMVLVSTVIWSAVAATSFELARMYRSYDYRSFFQHLLGRAWFLYEICYFGLLLIVLAVIAAAAGSILEETFSLHYAIGVITIMIAVGFLAFRGTAVIEKFFAGWSFVLYAVYLMLFVWCFIRFGPDIVSGFGAVGLDTDWIVGGIEYAAYNLALIPAILFTPRQNATRSGRCGAPHRTHRHVSGPSVLRRDGRSIPGDPRRGDPGQFPARYSRLSGVSADLPDRLVRNAHRDRNRDDSRRQRTYGNTVS